MTESVADAEGVLLTGLYGTGKSSVAEEIAVRLEHAGAPFAALDLDWLGWYSRGGGDEHGMTDVVAANITAVVGNYLGAGIRYFVLAGWIRDEAAAGALRATLPFAFAIVELRAAWAVIERRLSSSPTTGRADDLRVAREHRDDPSPRATAVLDVDRPLGEIADEVLALVGWLS